MIPLLRPISFSSATGRRERRLSLTAFSVAVTCLILFLSGCGGGGGGGDNGTGIDPIEVEVGVALDSFLSAINAGNATQALTLVDPDLQYWRASPLRVEKFAAFKTALEQFVAGAASISVTVPDKGISSSGEDSAVVRGTLAYQYLDSQGTSRSASEHFEMQFERISIWRIRSLNDRDGAVGLQFPPKP